MQQHMTVIVLAPMAQLDWTQTAISAVESLLNPFLATKKTTNCYKLWPNVFARLLHTL